MENDELRLLPLKEEEKNRFSYQQMIRMGQELGLEERYMVSTMERVLKECD